MSLADVATGRPRVPSARGERRAGQAAGRRYRGPHSATHLRDVGIDHHDCAAPTSPTTVWHWEHLGIDDIVAAPRSDIRRVHRRYRRTFRSRLSTPRHPHGRECGNGTTFCRAETRIPSSDEGITVAEKTEHAALSLPRWRDRPGHRPGHRRGGRHCVGAAAGQDRLHDVRRGLRQHRLHQERHHLHRRRRGDPALPRLPDRAARGEVELHRGQLSADLRRAADHRAAGQVHHPDPAAHAAARGPQAVLRRLPAQRAPDAGAVQRRQRVERRTTRTRWTRSTTSRSSSRRSGCSPSCRPSRRMRTRSPSGSRSCTRTTR